MHFETHFHDGTAFLVAGEAGAPELIFIHGLGLNRDIWRDYLPELSRDYRVVAYDLIGHGNSALPARRPGLSLFSGQLAGLMDHLRIDQALLIGFSLGGMINRRFAIDHPDRVSGLAILNSPHERGAEAQRLVEERAASSSSGGPAAGLETTLQRWFTARFLAANPDYIDQVRHQVGANDPQAYAQCREVLAKGVLELIRPQPPIDCPTLVMTCEHDSGSTPAMSEKIGQEIWGSEVVIVPELQHMGLVERPDLFLPPLKAFAGRVYPSDGSNG